MTIFHCVPVEAYWDLNIKNAVCTIDPGKFMFGTTLVHLMLEIAVLSLLVLQVKNMQLRLGQKVAVVAMFMFGIVVCAASIVVLVQAITLDSNTTELARDIRGVIIWAGTEAYFAVISSCLPTTRPVFLRLIYGSAHDSKSKPTDPSSLSGFSGSKGIKLGNTTRKKDMNDDSSQRELAQSEHRLSSEMDSDSHPERVGNHNTVITSCADEEPNRDGDTGRNYGIQVKNETNVYYERI